MERHPALEQQLLNLLNLLALPEPRNSHLDTRITLHTLASLPDWSSREYEQLDFLSGRFEISGHLYHGYRNDGHRTDDTRLSETTWLELFVLLLLRALIGSASDTAPGVRGKRLNTLLKALDRVQPSWRTRDPALGKLVDTLSTAVLDDLRAANPDHGDTGIDTAHTAHAGKAVTIPLTLLFYEGPIARAYLGLMKSLGYLPERIIELVAGRDIVSKKPVGRWLPSALRLHYAASIQRDRINYWPGQLLRQHPALVENIQAELAQSLGFTLATLQAATRHCALNEYSRNVTSLLVDGLSDSRLFEHLQSSIKSPVLFTGGGMVPPRLLNMEKVRFLHVHPGLLPGIRGADCTLWSYLLHGRASASCFYMAEGIDTGDIIHACWLPALSFDIDLELLDTQTQYRLVYGFIDPWIRAFCLRNVLTSETRLDELPSVAQTEAQGTHYHFMHERIRRVALDRLLRRENRLLR